MAMPNITKMVILTVLYNKGEMHTSDLQKHLFYHKGYKVSDGLLSTVINDLADRGYIEVKQKFSKERKIIRLKSSITKAGKEYCVVLQEKYIKEINRINKALNYCDFVPTPRNKKSK